MANHLIVGTSRRGRATVVTVAGELDIASAPELQFVIERVLSSDGAEVVVDLAELRFIDLSGMRALTTAGTRARERGGRLALINIPPVARRVVELTGDEQLLELEQRPE